MDHAIASLDHVTKDYGNVAALRDVSVALASGQVTALLGPNGAGKTTAVRLMLGLARPSSGTARLFDRDPQDHQARQRMGVMLQVAKVPETLTAAEHLHLFSSYYPSPLPMQQVLEAAGLLGVEHRPFGTLSGGQRQRVLFALALCGDPELLVLDEPTVGLDVESRQAFWQEIRRLVANGRSLLLTTHYLEEADALADRIVVLQRGRVIADGTPEDIKAGGAGQQIRCVTALTDGELATLPGVCAVRHEGDRVCLTVNAAESVTRELLVRDRSLSQLEIARATLEEAFLSLTANAEDAPLATAGATR